jgi:hypothetical protein
MILSGPPTMSLDPPRQTHPPRPRQAPSLTTGPSDAPSSTRAQFEILALLVRSTRLYRLQTGRDFDRIPQLLRETLQ